jgi:uncharacterized phage-associated protein
MANVFDVAAYIVEHKSPITTVKLQKLVYYSQAWSLVWDDLPLFEEEIQAWANGPVVYELFDYYRGNYAISKPPTYGDSKNLLDRERETIDVVLSTYGDLSAQKLSFLTHTETPWRAARGDLADTERSNVTISQESMSAYYSAVENDRNAVNVEEIDWSTLVTRATGTLEDV